MIASAASRDGLPAPRPARGLRWPRAVADRGGKAAGAAGGPAAERQPHRRPRAARGRPVGRGACRNRHRRWCRSTSRSCARRFRSRGCRRALRATCSRRQTTSSTSPASNARSPALAGRSRRARPSRRGRCWATPSRSGADARWPSSRSRSRGTRARVSRSCGWPRSNCGSRRTWRSGISATSSSELEALIVQYPLREQLRSQHMLRPLPVGPARGGARELPGVSADARGRARDRAVGCRCANSSARCCGRMRRSTWRSPGARAA